MGSPFKMKGFGGFGNSPLRQEKHFLEKEKTIPQVGVKTPRESAKARSAQQEAQTMKLRELSSKFKQLKGRDLTNLPSDFSTTGPDLWKSEMAIRKGKSPSMQELLIQRRGGN